MKIGIFDPYLDDLGGGEKYIMTAAVCLSKQHDVSIFWDNEKNIEELKKRFSLTLENIHIKKNIFSSQLSFFQRNKIAREYDAIVIVSDGSIPFIFPTKLYLHIQQPLPKHTGHHFKDNIKRRHISAIFYNSQFTKKYNDAHFPGVKSNVIYPPVDFEEVKKDYILQKENIIVHVGRYRVKTIDSEDYKKQGFMIEAFKKLYDRGFRKWKFLLAASVKKEDEDTFSLLRHSAKDYPIEFHVNKSNKELFLLYEKAKLYWHASGYGEDLENHPELAEHFGITTVEAMGKGVVPVVIGSGGQTEIVTDNVNGLLWDTLEELLNKTERVIKDEKLWKELSEQAIIRAQDFSEEKFCQNINHLITE